MIKLKQIFPQLIKTTLANIYPFSQNPKFKIIDNPKDVSKLVFDQDGRCLIFEHKNGESELKWIVRVSTIVTTFNTLLTGFQYAYSIFGAWNQFSFSVCSTLGIFFLTAIQIMSRRTVHKIHLHNNLQYVDLTFFNAFWIPKVVTFHISQFQQPSSSYVNFIRFELTSLGKIWIKLEKNQFRNIKDYEETLHCVLLGKPLTNLANPNKKNNK